MNPKRVLRNFERKSFSGFIMNRREIEMSLAIRTLDQVVQVLKRGARPNERLR
jgi:hypothetical protein